MSDGNARWKGGMGGMKRMNGFDGMVIGATA
jgi:hypothetical protein